MKALFTDLKLSEHEASHRQIHAHVRNLITSGKLPPGTRIPSSEELSTLWKTHAPTIQAALAPLVKEGWLVRRPRKGTFIRQREEKLARVCIFLPRGRTSFSAFQQAFYAELVTLMHDEGIEPDVWVDPRPAESHGEPWEPLVRAAEQRRIQAVVMIGTDLLYTRWVSKLPVPSAFWTSAGLPQSVRSDGRMFADLTLAAVTKQGCRSVGLITTTHPHETDPYGKVHIHEAFFHYFSERAAELGVTVRNDWMRLPDLKASRAATKDATQTQQEYGYQQFQRLWDLPQHPEALIVAPDTVAAGVISAVLHRGVSVPTDLKLVLAKNAHVDLFCPVPATLIVTDERELAQGLLEQVHRQFRGERCEPITVGFTVANSLLETTSATKRKGTGKS